LTVKRLTDTGTLDGYYQPVFAESTLATVKGLIQPRTAREVALLNQAGAVVSDMIGYIDPLPGLTTACWIELAAPADMAGRYDIVSMSDAAGLGHHLELGLQAVV
jgi:hypothetical protein